MLLMNKVIITCAITGAIHTPSMSPHLPIAPDQIVDEAIAASEAGAAILHLHARDPETGRPDQTPDGFARFLPRLKQRCSAVINLTTGGSPYMRVEERVRPAAQFKPEVASLNMGSINFGLYHLLERYKEFKFDWERQHLEATRDLVFRNSFKDLDAPVPRSQLSEGCHACALRLSYPSYGHRVWCHFCKLLGANLTVGRASLGFTRNCVWTETSRSPDASPHEHDRKSLPVSDQRSLTGVSGERDAYASEWAAVRSRIRPSSGHDEF
jgi:beta-keto acid cleavage enzyme